MRLALLAIALAAVATGAVAQTAPAMPAPPAAAPTPAAQPAADPQDVASVDAIVAALYDVISGPAGPRDWDRFHSLFQPGAMMGAAGRPPSGGLRFRALTPQDYAARNGAHFLTNAFYEREIGRRTARFGPIVQLMSAYETRDAPDAAKPVQRGVNSITLFDDGTRLWITSVTWAAETPETPIPAEFLPTP